MYSARVLIVEDETEWQAIVKELLADEEHHAFIANSYDGALALLKQDSFNIVFLDMMLHEFDTSVREGSGWKLLNYLVEKHPHTKIIVLSGRATAGDAVKLMRDYPIAMFIDKGDTDVEAQIMDAVHKAMQVPSLRIQTFGSFRIWRDGQLIDPWPSPQAKTLLKILLAQRVLQDRTIPADQLLDAVAGDQATKTLLPVLNSARQSLEPTIEPRDSNFILRNVTGYYFDLGSTVTWDVAEFRKLIQQGGIQERVGDFQGAITAYEAAQALYIGDFLSDDPKAMWAIPQRRTLQTEYRDSLLALAELYGELQRYTDAAHKAEEALKIDPLLESAYRQLMRYNYLAGNKEQALKVYRNCEKLFGEVYGESLSPQTKHLFELISSDAKLAEWLVAG